VLSIALPDFPFVTIRFPLEYHPRLDPAVGILTAWRNIRSCFSGGETTAG
jgi:hypothetical protein